ncbi:hypothetical protein P9112_007218 [Eukaryota sp. TZLM1-RC]
MSESSDYSSEEESVPKLVFRDRDKRSSNIHSLQLSFSSQSATTPTYGMTVLKSALGEQEEGSTLQSSAIPDDDDSDELAEFEAWKFREIQRLAEDHQRQLLQEQEYQEKQRRRRLTDEQLIAQLKTK